MSGHLGQEDHLTRAALFGFGWLRPELAALALLGVLVLVLGWWAVHKRSRVLAALVAARQFPRFISGWSVNRARARFVLAAAALVLLGLCAAGPVRGFTLREVRRRGLDLVVCIDTSRSMLVRDLRPDRITRARREVRGLLERLRGDRMALIAFAGDAREIAPLTHDRTALAAMLETTSPAENEKGGTDLGAALERALAMFDGRTGANECIVMLTDGEDLEGRGMEVALKAKERGVKVFVVGMGTESGGKIPVARQGGGESFLRDAENREVVSVMGGEGLDELASTTGGAYLSAQASAAPLEELYEKRISRLEARELQSGQEFVPHDRFQWFLALAAACMLAAAALGEQRSRSRQRSAARSLRGRAGSAGSVKREKPAWARAVAPLFLLAGPQTTPVVPTVPPPVPPTALPAAPLPAPLAEVRAPVVAYDQSPAKGLRELRAQLQSNDLEGAASLGERLDAMANLGELARAEIDYHRGVVHARRGEFAAASAAFAQAGGQAPAGGLRLDAWYNAGTSLLEVAEQAFFAIPEVREARQLPPLAPVMPPAPSGPPGVGATASKAPPPNADLDLAAEGYRSSKQSLSHRLRADARDVDTRANLELIQRRLKELEELRKKREEEKQEQEQQPDSKEKPESDEKQDPDKSKEDDSKQEPKPDESQEQKPSEEESKPKPEEDQPKPEKPKEGESKPEDQPKPADLTEERVLSKEEILRLLDQLANIEEEAQQLQARIRARQRVPVEKDW